MKIQYEQSADGRIIARLGEQQVEIDPLVVINGLAAEVATLTAERDALAAELATLRAELAAAQESHADEIAELMYPPASE